MKKRPAPPTDGELIFLTFEAENVVMACKHGEPQSPVHVASCQSLLELWPQIRNALQHRARLTKQQVKLFTEIEQAVAALGRRNAA